MWREVDGEDGLLGNHEPWIVNKFACRKSSQVGSASVALCPTASETQKISGIRRKSGISGKN